MTRSPNRPTIYPPQDPVSVGMKCRCPRCGEGALFPGLLTVRPECTACKLDYSFNDAGDGAAIFIIMGLGFIILGGALYVEFTFYPPVWVHFLLWPPLIFVLGLPAMRMLKGVLIALTYAHEAGPGSLVKTPSHGSHAQQAAHATPTEPKEGPTAIPPVEPKDAR